METQSALPRLALIVPVAQEVNGIIFDGTEVLHPHHAGYEEAYALAVSEFREDGIDMPYASADDLEHDDDNEEGST